MFEAMATLLFVVWCFLAVQTVLNLLLFRKLKPASRRSDTRVSIVIPARNEERYIGRTLDAALRQDYGDFELIVVDSCSTDDTARVLRDVSERDARIRVVTEDMDRGAGAARNRGIEVARGEYIAFLDADDVYEPHKLQLQLEILQIDLLLKLLPLQVLLLYL